MRSRKASRRPRIVRQRGVLGVVEWAHSLLYRGLLLPASLLALVMR